MNVYEKPVSWIFELHYEKRVAVYCSVRFVARSVTDYSTYVVNIVTHIENIHATLSTDMYRQI